MCNLPCAPDIFTFHFSITKRNYVRREIFNKLSTKA